MFLTRLARQIKFQRIRQFHSTFIKNEKKSVLEASTITQASKPAFDTANENVIGSPFHNVTKIDKWLLVWVKRYPSRDQVPPQIPIESIQRAYSKVRIRVCFLMMIATAFGFFCAAMSGKKEAADGKNMFSESAKYYKAQEEEARKEAKEKGAAES